MFAVPKDGALESCNCPVLGANGIINTRAPVAMQVKKMGPNFGRWFWKCPNNVSVDERGCNMFCWVGEEEQFKEKQRMLAEGGAIGAKRPRVEHAQPPHLDMKKDIDELAGAITKNNNRINNLHTRIRALELAMASKAFVEEGHIYESSSQNTRNLLVSPGGPPISASSTTAPQNERIGLLNHDQYQQISPS